MDIQTWTLVLECITLGFVCVLEVTIVTISYRAMRAALDLQRKLTPVITVIGQVSDTEMRRVGSYLQRQLKKWSAAEAELEKQGL